MKTYIYILVDPISNQIRYVGKSNNPEQRYKNHKNRCRDKNTHKRNWINKLRLLGKYPEIEIIDIVFINEWKYWERFWISYFKSIGANLTNYCIGGEGLTFGNQTSFKKGQKPWNLGKHHSEKTRKILSDINKGKASKKRIKIEQYSKEELLLNTFMGSYEAASSVGGQPIHILNVCKGKRKSHKGFIWKFKK